MTKGQSKTIGRSEGGATDVFGRFLPFKKGANRKRKADSNRRSILAQCAQATELHLLQPVIDAAIEEAEKTHPRWRIALWQHDGFSFWFREPGKSKRIRKRIRDLVDAHAKSQGIPTRLEEGG